jgi:hypothetical protein
MNIQVMEAPSLKRKSKYGYGPDEVAAANAALGDGKTPGDGPFDTEGQARSAAQALVRALGRADVGTRSWEAEDGWYFIVKIGRRKKNGEGAKPQASGKGGKGGKK